MPADWIWDETLFAGAAPHYRRGRLPYAPALPTHLATALALTGQGRLIDVGCGPGVLSLSLAHLFAEVIGVDPDPGMIAEAHRATATADIRNVRWVQARAEDLPAGLGTFTVATFAQSFHWMNRELVAATMWDMLQPGGALVHVSDLKGEPLRTDDLPHPAPPYAAMTELVRQWLGPVRRAGRGVLPGGTPSGEAEVFARAGFTGPRRVVVPGGEVLERGSDELVSWVFSLSSSAPHLFGAQVEEFETELRQLLAEASPEGSFAERQPSTEVFIWKRR